MKLDALIFIAFWLSLLVLILLAANNEPDNAGKFVCITMLIAMAMSFRYWHLAKINK